MILKRNLIIECWEVFTKEVFGKKMWYGLIYIIELIFKPGNQLTSIL
jgi:hypothetical protein